jgi:hypothetical protein
VTRTSTDRLLRDLTETEESRCSALVAGDAKRLAQLLDPRLIYIHASARVEHRDAILATTEKRGVRFLAFDHDALSALPLGSAAALLSGIIHIHIDTDTGELVRHCRFSSCWSLANTGWQLVSWQNTNLPPA